MRFKFRGILLTPRQIVGRVAMIVWRWWRPAPNNAWGSVLRKPKHLSNMLDL